MPKLTHPLIKSFSHDGETYEAGEDGSIDFPDHVLGVAFAHGFKHPVATAKLPEGEAAADIVAALAQIAVLQATGTEQTEKLEAAEAANAQLRNLVATSDAAKADLERDLAATKAELAKFKKVKA